MHIAKSERKVDVTDTEFERPDIVCAKWPISFHADADVEYRYAIEPGRRQ